MDTISSFWWKCLKKAWGRAWGLFGHFRGMAAILASAVMVLGGYKLIQGLQPNIGFWLVVAPPGLFLLVLSWQLFRAPFDVFCKERKESEAREQSLKQEAQATLESFNKQLQSSQAVIRTLKDDKTPLELVYRNGTPYVINDVLMSRFLVGVVNTGINKSARNVSLKLVSMEPRPGAVSIQRFPMKLKPKLVEDDTINPKTECLYDLIRVDYESYEMKVFPPDGQPFEGECNDDDWFNRKRYILTVQASGESSPSVEKRFELSFDIQNEPHVTLTPLI